MGRIELYWLTVTGVVLFVVHLARMEIQRYLARCDLSGRSHRGDVLMAILFERCWYCRCAWAGGF